MNKSKKLTAAALVGLFATTVAGNSFADSNYNDNNKAKMEKTSGKTADTKEKHACKGKNSCKGQGANGKNACKGKGSCRTDVAADANK